MITQTAAAVGGEQILQNEIDDHISALAESKENASCESHKPLADAMILSLRINRQFLDYVGSPTFKIVAAILTLGGGSATLLAAKVLIDYMNAVPK